MNKRTFLRLCSVVLTAPVLGRLLGWAQGDRLKNWAGNLEYGTEKLSTAESLERVQEFVRKEKDRKSTRLNSSHLVISYAVFCLIKITVICLFVSMLLNKLTKSQI